MSIRVKLASDREKAEHYLTVASSVKDQTSGIKGGERVTHLLLLGLAHSLLSIERAIREGIEVVTNPLTPLSEEEE